MINLKKNMNDSAKWLAALALTLAFCGCVKIPEWCGEVESFDFGRQFCFEGTAHYKCGGQEYDPNTHYCNGNVVTIKTYTVTVSSEAGATGGGNYMKGELVTISAGTPLTSQKFKNWTAVGVTLTDDDSATTTFIMPANDVVVTAVFEVEISSGWIGGYEYVGIGSLKWMKKNLDIKTDESWCYGEGGPVVDDELHELVTISNSEVQANCANYGRLYTWSDAKASCQQVGDGWRLPTRADWDALAAAVGGRVDDCSSCPYRNWYDAGKYLKSTDGFSALPGGFYFGTDINMFNNAGLTGLWWTDAEYDADNAYRRYIFHIGDFLYEDYNGKDGAISVRCVMDAP